MRYNYIERYKKACYQFGKHLDRKPRDNIAKMLYQADVEMTPGMFISLWLFTTLLSAFSMLIVSSIVFATSKSPFLFTSVLTVVAFLTIGIAFPFALHNKISNKKMDIERKLPYALAHMSILASAGSTPLDVIRRLALEDYGHISKEFRKVLYRVDVLGEDAVTAMNDLINNTPSEIFRSICIDLTNIIHAGGGLRGYLETKSKDLMNIKRQTHKEFVDSLAVYGEGYLGGIVMSVVLSVLAIVLCGALGIELGHFKPKELFFIFVYLITPLINVIFLLLLEVKYSKSG